MIALLGLVAGLLLSPPQAQASSTILCKGFTACEKAGYSSFGYGPSNYKKMWWRMYSGHNCTNYMAYRMIKAGMPVDRPWKGSGDARNWGVVFKSKVNQTPMIGSVAWWSSNHVAYVQQIVDANTIIISEDHYRGDFDWRKITRAGGGWPTGFIHLVDEAVTSTAPPTITGTPKVDQTLTAKPGTWNRAGATYKYQWLAAGKAIAGATTATYRPTAAQVGQTFSVKVTASKAGYKTGTRNTAVSKATVPGTMAVDGEPVISGIPKVGATLTASVPTFAPAAEGIRYGWFADGRFIPGGSGTSITLKPEQLGKAVRFVATANRTGYDAAPAASAPTVAVLPEKLAVTAEPRLVGNAYVGRALTVTPGAVAPKAAETYQWLRDGKPIAGATNARYVPSALDPGTRLSVRVSFARPGYTTVVRDLKIKREVHAFAKIAVASRAHRQVTVAIYATGVTGPRGTVTLLTRSGKKMTLTLKNGKATFAPSWLHQGERTLTVVYSGSSKVHEKTTTRTVAVK